MTLEKDYTSRSRRYDHNRYLNRKANFTSAFETELLRTAIARYAAGRRLLVDVACGTGHFTVQVADLFDRVLGIDLTPAMLEKAAAKAATRRPPVHFVQASANQLPFADGIADVVMSTRFLHLFRREDHRQLVESLIRIVCPGGVLLLEHDWFYGLLRRGRTKYWSTYHPSEMPAEKGTRLARLGVLAPGIPTLALVSRRLAWLLGGLFVRAPLNRLSTRVVLVYRKPHTERTG